MTLKGEILLRIAVLSALALSGCATVEPANGARNQFYIGGVSVIVPRTQGEVSAVRVKTFGVGIDEGFYLGWRSGEWIKADPEKCHLMIIIRSAAEAANAAKVLELLEGQDPCVVDFTGSLPA